MRPIKKAGGSRPLQISNRFRCLSDERCGCEDIHLIDWEDQKGIHSVGQQTAGWERISMKIDSGAVDTVIPKNVVPHIPAYETARSKEGNGFRAANGSHIKHFGQKTLEGVGDGFQPIHLVAQVAEVHHALGSVYRMVQSGNAVHFEKGRCYIQHLASGQITPITEKGSAYEIGVWVPGGAAGFPGQER